MNKYYTYPEIRLWDPETWKPRLAVTDALMDTLVPLCYEALYEETSRRDRFPDRTDGSFNPKTNTYDFADVIGKWEGLGLKYHCTSMGFIAWIAMVPSRVLDGSVRGPKVLVVPHTTDLRNPHWAMNTLEDLAVYHKTAAETDTVMLYLVFNGPRSSGIYMDIMLELSAIFHVDMGHCYMDLTHLEAAGKSLSDVPGLKREKLGEETRIGEIPAVNITGQWVARVGHQFICNDLNRRTKDYSTERHEHSTVGRLMAESMRWEFECDDANDPRLLARWEQMGLQYEEHRTAGERWLTFVPKDALEATGKKIPLLLVMKEVREIAPFLTLTAFQFYDSFFEIASQGECAMLFFALETPDDNELLTELVKEAVTQYPIDPERVYIIGQSHNGYFALEFARRHPDLIAAVAQLNDRHYINAPQYSVDNVKMTDEMIDGMAQHDLPLINICGHAENVFAHVDPDSSDFRHDCEGFNRRLRAFRCPERPLEEIMQAHLSRDKATRMNGIPADHTEIRYCMGSELYISHLKNKDGRWQLDLVSVENLPHMITPQMAELSWSFLRRFARDRKTGRIKELY